MDGRPTSACTVLYLAMTWMCSQNYFPCDVLLLQTLQRYLIMLNSTEFSCVIWPLDQWESWFLVWWRCVPLCDDLNVRWVLYALLRLECLVVFIIIICSPITCVWHSRWEAEDLVHLLCTPQSFPLFWSWYSSIYSLILRDIQVLIHSWGQY